MDQYSQGILGDLHHLEVATGTGNWQRETSGHGRSQGAMEGGLSLIHI